MDKATLIINNGDRNRTMKYARCKKCGASIVFLPTTTGKQMPVNADTVVHPYAYFDIKVHRSHFADCPAASVFRKPAKKRAIN